MLLKAVAAGLPNKTAAELAGIDPRTLYQWKRRGKAGEEPFVQFLHALRVRQAKAVQGAMKAIAAAAERGEWRAAAWWLERRHPDEYGSERKRLRELAKLLDQITKREAGPPLTHEQRVAELTRVLGAMGLAVVPAGSVNSLLPPATTAEPVRPLTSQSTDGAAGG